MDALEHAADHSRRDRHGNVATTVGTACHLTAVGIASHINNENQNVTIIADHRDTKSAT